MLSLALVYNDVRDLWIGRTLLFETQPKEMLGPTPAVGQYFGRLTREVRLTAGVVHELFEIVRSNQKAMKHPVFQKAIKRTLENTRADWKVIVMAALEEEAFVEGSLGWSLHRIRNKVGYHYDAKILGDAFRSRFQGAIGTRSYPRTCLSSRRVQLK
jgi:hypothetical protein